MNRGQKRKQIRRHSKPKFSLIDVQKAISIALEMRKASKGHLFSKSMKERCVFCGKSRKARTDCEYWFLTFIDRMQTVLINPTFFTDKEIEALWLQHGDEYEAIRIPLQK